MRAVRLVPLRQLASMSGRCSCHVRAFSTAYSSESSSSSSSLSSAGSSSTPWYLRNEGAVEATKEFRKTEALPEFPNECPGSVKELSQFMVQELSLSNLAIVDLRSKSTSFGPDAIMLVSTGKGAKHILRAGQSLVTFIKQKYGTRADTEGLLSSNFLRVLSRRMRKRAQRKGLASRDQSGFIEQGDESYGEFDSVQRAGSWVVLNVGDVYVHIFSEQKRKEVDLETFWTESDLGSSPSFLSSPAPLTPSISSSSPSASQDTSSPTLPSSQLRKSKFDKRFQMPPGVRYFHHYSPLGNSSSTATARLKDITAELEKLETSPTDKVMDITQFVQDFGDVFPNEPTLEQRRVQLVFLHRAHMIDPSSVPLETIMQALEDKQASGYVLDEWDVDYVLGAILASCTVDVDVQTVATVGSSKDTAKQWMDVCSKKMEFLLRVHELAFRAPGKSMVQSDVLLAMLYRALCSGTRSVISVDEAIKEPYQAAGAGITMSAANSVYVDYRAQKILDMLLDTSGIISQDKNVLVMVVSTLINGGLWNKFWSLWKELTVRGGIDQDLLVIIVSLIVRTGDETNINHLLQSYLPGVLADGKSQISSQLQRAIDAGLKNNNDAGSFKSIQQYLS